MLLEISARVEATAVKIFKSVQGNHKKIADNYLSLKAYCVTARGKLSGYVKKGGKNLSSLGELMTAVAGMSSVKARKAEGIGSGASTIPAIFSAKNVKVSNVFSKINGLVNEYSGVLARVRRVWPMGLGKYLLMKLEESMLAKGVLQEGQLRVRQRSHRRSVQQAQRLRGPRRPHEEVRGYPRRSDRQARWQGPPPQQEAHRLRQATRVEGRLS